MLRPRDVPAIRPEIALLDEANGVVSHVFDMTIGLDESHQEYRQLNHDILEYYYRGVKLVRGERGRDRRMTEFVRNCGAICVEGAINYDSEQYMVASEYALLDREDPNAAEQLDLVIKR